MKQKIYFKQGIFLLAILFFSFLIESVNAYNIVGGGVCTCSSCSDCTNALNDNKCSYVKLTADIIDHSGTCIDNPQNFNNKIFDCQGHKIGGYGWDDGIYLHNKQNNTIRNCIITDFYYGIYLDSSSNNTLINNTMNNNRYNFNICGGEISYYYQDIDTSNTVNGKPIYYWTNEKNAPNNCKNAEINELSNAGFVALVGCDNITVKNLNLENNSHGILLVNTTNSRILNNTASSNRNYGIYLVSSSNNTLIGNNVSSNNIGIPLLGSLNNILTGNNVNLNWFDGIYLYSSSNNILTGNNVDSNYYEGIVLIYSSYNTLTGNNVDSNGYGISLYSSSNNTLTGNNVSSNNFGIYITDNSNFNKILNNEISNNNETGIVISNCSPWGYCYDGNTNNTIEGNKISNNKIGIFSNSSNSTINSNFVCGNTNYDFYSDDWQSSTGNNNRCDKPDGWNDTGTTGCTFSCGVCTCDSCSDCMNKLNNASCTEVYLTANITDYSGTCINNPENFNNKIFDCQGHTIDGNDAWQSSGIYLNGKQNNTIRNCVITDFNYGIVLDYSSNNTLINNAMNNNTYNFNIDGWEISHYYQDIDTSNTVNGKPIYYWTNEKNAP
ncbi:MAG: nitrous oxide reductase family maturation protein NosD, partial [Candidatus Altarchaeaceae archaeon]